jgi:hypothetical protein
MIAAGCACLIAAEGGGPRPAAAEAVAAAPAVSSPDQHFNGHRPAAAEIATMVIGPDQRFSGCKAARAAGRTDIPSWDPSYREWMDGDRDGFACEPYRGG